MILYQHAQKLWTFYYVVLCFFGSHLQKVKQNAASLTLRLLLLKLLKFIIKYHYGNAAFLPKFFHAVVAYRLFLIRS